MTYDEFRQLMIKEGVHCYSSSHPIPSGGHKVDRFIIIYGVTLGDKDLILGVEEVEKLTETEISLILTHHRLNTAFLHNETHLPF